MIEKKLKTSDRKEYTRNYRKDNKEKVTSWRRKTHLTCTYDLTLEEYDNIYKEQKGCCAICGVAESRVSKNRLNIDHDHKTGKVRGLLCNVCNIGLGFYEKYKENYFLYLSRRDI